MKYSSYIDNVTSEKWGLNVQSAYLFSWIYDLPSWAETITTPDGIFYFASKSKVIEEIPLLTDKIDTVYRYYKFLEEFGLIILRKIEGKDFIKLTEKAKEWGRDDLGKKSEHSEKNPDLFGFKSENGSEKNPTYKTTNTDKTTIDKRKQVFCQKLDPYTSVFGKDFIANFIAHWTEHNENGYKMRFEAEKFFDLKKRLATWKRIAESNPKFKNRVQNNIGKIG